MLVGWVGDSSAILVKNGAVLPLVNPHRPNRIVGVLLLHFISFKKLTKLFVVVYY